MKRLFAILSLIFGLLIPDMVYAQSKSYMVYSVIGDIYIQKGQQKTRLRPRSHVSNTDIVIIPKGAALNLLDEASSSMRSLSIEGKMELRDLLALQKNSPKSLSKQYFAYLVKQLFNSASQKMSHPDCYMQSTGTSYRSDDVDSIFLSTVVSKLPALDADFEKSIVNENTFPTSDLNVSFSIISCNTGLSVKDRVSMNESCYLAVKNGTDQPLYVNVLDIGKDGSKYLLLPVDSASTCAHLLVPGQSEIEFKADPFIFGKEAKDETFVLFAVDTPIDFSILMNPIRASGKQRSPIMLGIYKRNVKIH